MCKMVLYDIYNKCAGVHREVTAQQAENYLPLASCVPLHPESGS